MPEPAFQILSLYEASVLTPASCVTIGIDAEGAVPSGLADCFDILLTTRRDCPREWIHTEGPEETLAHLRSAITRTPVAANMLVQLLRLSENLSYEEALIAESLTYSSLLGGSEFRRWRAENPPKPYEPSHKPRVTLNRDGNQLSILLTHAERRNAMDAGMRDALVDALQLPLLDDSIERVLLQGDGPCFSSGGDLAEFGTAKDLAAAHLIRIAQSPTRYIARQKGRGAAFLHGVCIGSGVEIGVAAAHVSAAEDTTFRLPELSMGLIPGAGGTVSIPRRIGRHRACFLMFSNQPIDMQTALHWKLIDHIGGPV